MDNITWFRQRLHDTKILLVEDNPINQIIVTDLLNFVGAKTTCADNGQLALNKITSESYDLIIMDVQMPIMDGYEATHQIRNVLQMVNLPIIAMTANSTSEDRKNCLNAGMNDFLPKPVSPNLMYMTLAKWLPEQRDQAENNQNEPNEKDVASPISFYAFRNKLQNDSWLVRKFSLKFIEVAEQAIAEIKIAKTNNDFESLSDQGHKLKSSAFTVGAFHFADLCDKLESAGKNKEIKLAEDLCAQITRSFQHVKQQLEEEFVKTNQD